MSRPLVALSDRMLNAEMTCAGKRYAARRAAKLHSEDSVRFAE